MKYKLLLGFVCACVVAGASSGAFAAKDKVFTWTDEKGVTHYGERPPKDAKARLVKTRTGHSEPVPSAAASPAPNSASVPAGASSDLERCTTARKNLELLNDSIINVQVVDADGVKRTMTEDEKAQQRQNMQVVIDQSCG